MAGPAMEEDGEESEGSQEWEDLDFGPKPVPQLRGKRAQGVRLGLPRRWPFVDEAQVGGVLRPPYGPAKEWDEGFTKCWANTECHQNLRSYFDRPRRAIDWGRPTVPGKLKVTWMLGGAHRGPLPVQQRRHRALSSGSPKDLVPKYRPRIPMQNKILGSSLMSYQERLLPGRSGPHSSSSLGASGSLATLGGGPSLALTTTSSVPALPALGGERRHAPASPWNDEFQHTYGARFNSRCHPNFRQYFGPHKIHSTKLMDVMGKPHQSPDARDPPPGIPALGGAQTPPLAALTG